MRSNSWETTQNFEPFAAIGRQQQVLSIDSTCALYCGINLVCVIRGNDEENISCFSEITDLGEHPGR